MAVNPAHKANAFPPFGALRHLGDLYTEAAKCYGGLPAFATRERRGVWRPLSFAALKERAEHIALGLMAEAVSLQDRVGLFSDNREAWILADGALQFAGAIDVPRGSDVTDGELSYILNHAEIKLTFVENRKLLERIQKITEGQNRKLRFILFEGEAHADESNVSTLAALEAAGKKRLSQAPEQARAELKARADALRPEHLFTLIYTSGTTGDPKGVMLTHANILSQIKNIPMPLTWRDRALSLLPIWHIYERVLEMITLRLGCCTYYSSIRTFADDLQAVEPTFMASAPRLWESLHGRILSNVEKAHPVRRGLFHTALWLSGQHFTAVTYLQGNELQNRPRSTLKHWLRVPLEVLRWFIVLPWYGFFNAAVLERLRQVAGGCLRGTISGGGALPKEIDLFFNKIGITVLEGYGLTETAPVLAVRRMDLRVLSTVGPLIPETELRLVDPETGEVLYPAPKRADGGRMRKGEICVRGPQVMPGYYKNQAATQKALRDGWFHTGDLGLVTWNECLRVMGRCKETIVLSSGENLEPSPIEMRLRQLEFIEQCAVLGQDQRHLALLAVPSPEAWDSVGVKDGASASEDAKLSLKKTISRLVKAEISGKNGFKPYERIHAVTLVETPFTIGEEITSLHKLRRHVIEAKYANQIAELFPKK